MINYSEHIGKTMCIGEGFNNINMQMSDSTISSLEFGVFDTDIIESTFLFHLRCSHIQNDLLSLWWLPVCQDLTKQ